MVRKVEKPDTDFRWTGREYLLLAAAVLPVIAVFGFIDPVPQSASYFDFADSRPLFGIPNFWNVASNALFFVFGAYGLVLVWRGGSLSIIQSLRLAYAVLFAGIALTAFGSGWFHLSPEIDTLYWDRLPMTIAFMSLVTVIFGEHVSARRARLLLWPLLLIGAASVFYWDYTESQGVGDLRFYGLVQFLPMLMLPAIMASYRSQFDTVKFYWVAIGLYALAKILEFLDVPVFEVGSLLSGHSLKHIAASLVPLALIIGMQKRNRVT